MRINKEHTCHYDIVVLRELLNRHGFTPVKIMRSRSVYKNAPSNFLIKIREDLAPTIIVIAKKKHK